MKKFITASFIFLLFNFCAAQINDIHNFNDTTGIGGSTLVYNNGVLYGASNTGGVNGYGCIYSVGTTGENYTDLYDFDNLTGANPLYSFVIHNNIIYGLTDSGGQNGYGCIFSFNLYNQVYSDIFDFNFDSLDIGHPVYQDDNLVFWNNKLYGTTKTRGDNSNQAFSLIFSIDTNGFNFKDVSAVLNSSPDFITVAGNKLVEITYNYIGDVTSIYSIDTGSNSKNLFFLPDTTSFYGNISSIAGPMAYSGGKLFGFFQSGGVYNYGTIFTIDTTGNNFKKLYDFNDTMGAAPQGSPLINGSTLWGMNNIGCCGVYDGNIFSIDSNGSNYSDKYDFGFNNPYADDPISSLVLNDDTLFGTTPIGGLNSSYAGIIFSYSLLTSGINEISTSNENVKIYPNPSTGKFHLEIRNYESNKKYNVEVYNALGVRVLSQYLISNSSFLIDLSGQPEGVYFYHLVDGQNRQIGKGKLVLER